MRDVVSHTFAQRTYSARLMTAFASLALLLRALGICGVVSYVTLQRTREFGIRRALAPLGKTCWEMCSTRQGR
jgi:putative ABC transport system permease protein